MNKKRYVVVESFDITEKTIVEAESKEEAEKIIFEDEEHSGDIIDCYETTAPMPKKDLLIERAKRDKQEEINKIMENITEDKNLVIIREALELFARNKKWN